jgi:AAA15 family ATPase/GTPase
MSIREEQVLSLLSCESPSDDVFRAHELSDGSGIRILNSVIICGPNASGKSNILSALHALRSLVLNSGKNSIDGLIQENTPFALDENFRNEPTRFSLEFYTSDLYEQNKLRRYSYTVEFCKNKIFSETLKVYKTARGSFVFTRNFDSQTKRGAYYKAKAAGIESSILDNQLYLSVAGNSKDNPLNLIYRYFRDCIYFESPGRSFTSSTQFKSSIPHQLHGENSEYYLKSIGVLLKAVDTGIQTLRLDKGKKVSLKFPIDIPKDIEEFIMRDLRIRPKTTHIQYKGNVKTGSVEFDIGMESEGTLRFFEFAGTMIDALRNGATLVVDELHQSLHPDLSRFIIRLFQNKSINRKNAQLIFTSHDLLLLTPELFGRDQVWFTEKDKYGATQLFSLLEFGKNIIRKDTNYYSWYTNGKFGALPSIDNDLGESLFKDGN